MDCGLFGCGKPGGKTPPACVGQNIEEGELSLSLERYASEENSRVLVAAAEVEEEGSGKWTRVDEIVNFCKKMGYKKIGVASCLSLLVESRTFAKVLRSHGFEVYGISCKAGTVLKDDMGITGCNSTGSVICNPILQAQMLNAEKTEFNVLVGLCVGHDSMFYKYSEALCTTLLTKDRVLVHNTAAALYKANSYYKKMFGEYSTD
ncbi:hypothetical protein SDC9_165286 [bioreactor metagenome]|uniref:Metal-binding protein n=1 Tax=bioreactor metagenome TaxID=1076179 RepID=A0A645FWH5_9ZZZZ